MVKFPPLFPSSYWVSNYIAALLKGSGESESILYANSKIISPKEFGRFLITDTKGVPNTLSLAIIGGGRQLRSFDKINDLKLSDHGDWRKNHLRAIESTLGKKPFFRYLDSPLNEIYCNKDIELLGDFNTAIFNILKTFLFGNLNPCDLKLFYSYLHLIERGTEIATKINPEISILQILAEFGRESMIGILALLK